MILENYPHVTTKLATKDHIWQCGQKVSWLAWVDDIFLHFHYCPNWSQKLTENASKNYWKLSPVIKGHEEVAQDVVKSLLLVSRDYVGLVAVISVLHVGQRSEDLLWCCEGPASGQCLHLSLPPRRCCPHGQCGDLRRPKNRSTCQRFKYWRDLNLLNSLTRTEYSLMRLVQDEVDGLVKPLRNIFLWRQLP